MTSKEEVNQIKITNGDWFTNINTTDQNVQRRAGGGGQFNGDKLEMLRQKVNEIIEHLNDK